MPLKRTKGNEIRGRPDRAWRENEVREEKRKKKFWEDLICGLDRFLCVGRGRGMGRVRFHSHRNFWVRLKVSWEQILLLFPAKARPPVYEAVILAYSAGSAVEIYARQLGNAPS